MMSTPIVALGEGPWSGAYVLRIRVSRAEPVVFGRFDHGAAVVVEPGDYLYIGSARSRRGTPALAQRVLRHLTRTGQRPPQPLRSVLLDYLAAQGWPDAVPPAAKTLRWHVDYLVDSPAAAIIQVLLARGDQPDEHALVAALERTGHTRPLRRGLGASDHAGHTHLLRWDAGEAAWQAWLRELVQRYTTARAAQ